MEQMLKEKRRVTAISVLAAVFLTGFKLIIGLLTGSLGILSEALHSGIDLVAAGVTFFSVKVSDKPADYDHNYGHGKFENFSALIETLLLLITCAWIIYEAVERLMSGRTHIEITVWSFVVVITSIFVDATRSRALYKVARKYNSQAIEADALHFSTDIWSSSVVLIGLVFAGFGIYVADSIAALGVAMIALLISYRLGRKAIDVLLDKAPPEIIEKVSKVLAKYSDVKYFHGLKVRTAGADTFIKFNIHLKPYLNLRHVHEVCDRIEQELKDLIPRSEIYIHPEPEESNHIDTDEGHMENVLNERLPHK
jgi:cation diffusion facilitator family transporter